MGRTSKSKIIARRWQHEEKGERAWRKIQDLPVDVAELMLTAPTFGGDGDVECATGGHGTADSRHDDHRDVLEWDVR